MCRRIAFASGFELRLERIYWISRFLIIFGFCFGFFIYGYLRVLGLWNGFHDSKWWSILSSTREYFLRAVSRRLSDCFRSPATSATNKIARKFIAVFFLNWGFRWDFGLYIGVGAHSYLYKEVKSKYRILENSFRIFFIALVNRLGNNSVTVGDFRSLPDIF